MAEDCRLNHIHDLEVGFCTSPASGLPPGLLHRCRVVRDGKVVHLYLVLVINDRQYQRHLVGSHHSHSVRMVSVQAGWLGHVEAMVQPAVDETEDCGVKLLRHDDCLQIENTSFLFYLPFAS